MTGKTQGPLCPEYTTMVEMLRVGAEDHPERLLYTFLEDGETQERNLTYGAIDRQARAIAARLQAMHLEGERVLLLYPPGLDFIIAFFGCLYAGVIAVPAYPPEPGRLRLTLGRLKAIALDSQASVVLATEMVVGMAEQLLESVPELAAMWWFATDTLEEGLESTWQEPDLSPNTLAFLQYTSGTTGQPRGVMVSHDNLLQNQAMIARSFGHDQRLRAHKPVLGVGWIPTYHDMGLIGSLLQPAYLGIRCVLMSPLHFLSNPLRWLHAISRYQGTSSGGPNFAYDLCVARIRRAPPSELESLDLSSWQIAFNGAEPIRQDTMARFARTFEPCGFKASAFYPCYGLAEATLFVAGGDAHTPPILASLNPAELARGKVSERLNGSGERVLVSSGPVREGLEVAIVHPETRRRCASADIGEIWVRGASVAGGYWNNPEETAQVFGAHLADSEDGPYLRTGDLGFLREGELFVAGRIKDLIIIRGRNHYPQDIEKTIDTCHPSVRRGSNAAFSLEIAGEERLALAVELNNLDATDGVAEAIRQAVLEAHQLNVHGIAFLRKRTLPKTSSGKVQRHACKEGFVAHTLEEVSRSILSMAAPANGVGFDGPVMMEDVEGLLHQLLLETPTQEQRATIERFFLGQLAGVLGIHRSKLDRHTPLVSLGLDSVTLLELRNLLESALAFDIATETFWTYPTTAKLSEHLYALWTDLRLAESLKPVAVPPPHQLRQGAVIGQFEEIEI